MTTHSATALKADPRVPPLVIEVAHVAEFVEKLSEAARQYEMSRAA